MRGVVGQASKYDECPYCHGARIDGPCGFVETFLAPYAKTIEESRRKGVWDKADNQPRALAEFFGIMNATLEREAAEGADVARILKCPPRPTQALTDAFRRHKGGKK